VLDIKHPLSPLQAFGIALSMFAFDSRLHTTQENSYSMISLQRDDSADCLLSIGPRKKGIGENTSINSNSSPTFLSDILPSPYG
jgi:hypothetical protein